MGLRSRIRDFSAVTEDIVPTAVQKFLMAVIRGWDAADNAADANRVYIRGKQKTVEILQPAGRSRRFVRGSDPDLTFPDRDPRGILEWSRKADGTTGTRLAWAGVDILPNPDVLLCEVLAVLKANGTPIEGSPPAILQTFTHPVRFAGATQLVIPVATSPWYTRAVSISPVLENVTDGVGGINIGIVQLNSLAVYNDFPLTPVGTWDLRAAISNFHAPTGLVRKPPTIVLSSATDTTWPGGGSGQNVLATRVIANPSFDGKPTTPTRQMQFRSFTRSISVNVTNAPYHGQVPGCGAGGNVPSPTWTSTSTLPATALKDEIAMSPRAYNLGVMHLESGANTVWLIVKIFVGESRFAYKYTTSMTVNTVTIVSGACSAGTPISTSGFIYLLDRIIWRVHGVKSLLNGATAYEDFAGNALTVARGAAHTGLGDSNYGERPLITAPAFTSTFRGWAWCVRFADVSGQPFVSRGDWVDEGGVLRPNTQPTQIGDPAGERFRIVPVGKNRGAAGDFWVLTRRMEKLVQDSLDHRIASQGGDFLVAIPMTSQDKDCQISEVSERLWVFVQPFGAYGEGTGEDTFVPD